MSQTLERPVVRRGGAAGRTARSRRRLAIWAVRLGVIGAGLLAWEVYGRTSQGVFIPSFSTTARAGWDLVRDGKMAEALWASNQSLLIGFPLSAIGGLALGLLLGRRRSADRGLSYLVDFMMVIPMIAVVPVIIVALGLTLTARVSVVVLFALPVITLNARASVRVVDHALTEMAAAFGARPRQVWQSVILPAALAPIFTGLRIGLSRAISGMIVVELTLVPAGLGGLLVTYKSQFAGPNLYAVTLAVLVEGFVLIGVAYTLERRIGRRLRGGADDA